MRIAARLDPLPGFPIRNIPPSPCAGFVNVFLQRTSVIAGTVPPLLVASTCWDFFRSYQKIPPFNRSCPGFCSLPGVNRFIVNVPHRFSRALRPQRLRNFFRLKTSLFFATCPPIYCFGQGVPFQSSIFPWRKEIRWVSAEVRLLLEFDCVTVPLSSRNTSLNIPGSCKFFQALCVFPDGLSPVELASSDF